MNRMLPIITRLVKGDDGQDLLEYGLLAVLIAAVAITGVRAVGTAIYNVFWGAIGRGF